MQIQLMVTTDVPNALHKTLIPYKTLQGSIKENTDIINPVILINNDGAPTTNYCFIPNFGRYYFINDITFKNNNLFYLHCSVDVLQSFKNDILNANVIATRSSSWYDNYLPDSAVENRADVEITYRKLGGYSFVPSAGSYVLQTVGNNPVT